MPFGWCCWNSAFITSWVKSAWFIEIRAPPSCFIRSHRCCLNVLTKLLCKISKTRFWNVTLPNRKGGIKMWGMNLCPTFFYSKTINMMATWNRGRPVKARGRMNYLDIGNERGRFGWQHGKLCRSLTRFQKPVYLTCCICHCSPDNGPDGSVCNTQGHLLSSQTNRAVNIKCRVLIWIRSSYMN